MATLAPLSPKKASSNLYRKGFFFTILALVLVSFMFISIQLWAQGQQASEQRQSERFRIEALRSSLALINNQSLSTFASASMLYAVNNLSDALEENPDGNVLPCATGPTGQCNIGPGATPYPDGTYYVNTSIAELMINGTTSGHILVTSGTYSFYQNGSNLTYNAGQQKYMLSNYFNQTSAAAAVLGYNLTYGDVQNFTFNQTSAWNISLFFQVPVNLTDQEGLVNISEVLGANVSMDINGLPDPMVLHEDDSYRPGLSIGERPHRNVYHSPEYNQSSNAEASIILNSQNGTTGTSEGLGWFFGPITSHPNSSFDNTSVVYNISKISQFIYMTGSESDAIIQSQYFGGIILLDASDPQNFQNDYYKTNQSFIQNSCNYSVYRQKPNCFYCLLHAISNNSAICPDEFSVATDNMSIPINPNISYVGISLNDFPGNEAHQNYHLSADGESVQEVLISSNHSASDIFGPNFQFNISFQTSQSPLMEKSSNPAYGNATIWDMTGPRDMAICGFYVPSIFGPSYLQRYVALPDLAQFHSAYSTLGQGIESFVLGQWAGGALDPNANGATDPAGNEFRSRVDYLFYQTPTSSQCEGTVDQGMPGCKSAFVCADPNAARQNSVGRFSLTTPGTSGDPTDRYGLDDLVMPSNLNPVYGKHEWCS